MTKGALLLKKIRLAKGYTQEDVAEFTGVARSTIACIESNESYQVSVPTAKALAEILGIKWTRFFEEGDC